jgi:flavin reductase (DIM6/NTAB) family NADH-FMN oxidoreductase RutF
MTTQASAPSAVAGQQDLRRAFALFPSGVTAVCALVDGAPAGLAASSFTTVSLDPPLVSVAFSARSQTWARLRKATRLGISVLAEHHADFCRVLAGPGDRFASVEWTAATEGAVHIKGSALMLTCSIGEVRTAGDHEVAFLQVEDVLAQASVEPLVFHGSKFRHIADRAAV